MFQQPILFEELPGKEGHIGLITLNRPETLNALTHEMIAMLHQNLLGWEEDDNIKGVIISATKGKAFCAGGDIRLVYEKQKSNDPNLSDFFRDEYRLNHYIFHYPKPYIPLLDGITMGGGAGISMHSHYRIGTENLLFAMPETSIGFFPDVGSSYFLSRLSHYTGFYLGLTGTRLTSDDCLALGLIDYKVSQKDLPTIIDTLTQTAFGSKPKLLIDTLLKPYVMEKKASHLESNFSLISELFSKRHIEEIIKGLETTKNPWCFEVLNELEKKSPISLKVTLAELHEGLGRDFDQCMQMEYHLMCHFLQGHDFFEGIRALLIDKDKNPQWLPEKLSMISQDIIENFFIPLPGQKAQLLFT